MYRRPAFVDLPRPNGETLPLAWGLEKENVGMLAAISAEYAAQAASLVRSGERVNLDLPLHLPLGAVPAHSHRIREAPVHELVTDTYEGLLIRDDCVTFHPQASSQWDSLAHVGDPLHGFYDGTQSKDIHLGDGSRNGVDRYADFGIFTRGIYIDLPEFYASNQRHWSALGSQICSANDLRLALEQSEVKPQLGDVLCVRTGWLEAFNKASPEDKKTIFQGRDYSGLAGDESMWQYLWDAGFAAVASDSVTVEAWPLEQGKPSLHLAIARLGLVLGEMFDLDALRAAVHKHKRNTFLFTSKPLNLRGAIGSPPNAMAIF